MRAAAGPFAMTIVAKAFGLTSVEVSGDAVVVYLAVDGRPRHSQGVSRLLLVAAVVLQATDNCVALEGFYLGQLPPRGGAALRWQLVGADSTRWWAGKVFGQTPPQLRDVARPRQPAEVAHGIGCQLHISTPGDLAQQHRHQFLEVVNPVSQRRHSDGMGKQRQQPLDRR